MLSCCRCPLPLAGGLAPGPPFIFRGSALGGPPVLLASRPGRGAAALCLGPEGPFSWVGALPPLRPPGCRFHVAPCAAPIRRVVTAGLAKEQKTAGRAGALPAVF